MNKRVCPKCRRDYGDRNDYPADTCMVCDVALDTGASAPRADPLADIISRTIVWPKDDDALQIYVANDFMEGQIIKSLLESADIPVLMRSDSIGHTYGLGVGGFTNLTAVCVPRSLYGRAQAVIAENDPL